MPASVRERLCDGPSASADIDPALPGALFGGLQSSVSLRDQDCQIGTTERWIDGLMRLPDTRSEAMPKHSI